MATPAAKQGYTELKTNEPGDSSEVRTATIASDEVKEGSGSGRTCALCFVTLFLLLGALGGAAYVLLGKEKVVAPVLVSEAPLHTFYMYRVQSDDNYSPENQNMASIGGALWYLHNEIVWHHWIRAGTYASTPKTRIERFLVKTRATPQLWARGMHFGVVNTYDLGQCTGPFLCENLQEYGPVVGCETWRQDVPPAKGSNFPHEQWVGQNIYPGAIWYSLPGTCSSRKFWNQTGSCRITEPSGSCKSGHPTGARDCTYTYKKVGEISINELEGITDFEKFVEDGGQEYDKVTDKGTMMTFWDGMNSTKECQRRIDTALAIFRKKYPGQKDLADPSCDFDVSKFYPHYPLGTFDHPNQTKSNQTTDIHA